MERFQELLHASQRKIQIADHILTQSYPLVKDPRLLLSSLENLFLGMSYGMTALLLYERMFKRIPPVPENFESKYKMFWDHIMPRHDVSHEHVMHLKEIKDIILEHRQSPIEFVRKDRLVICNSTYKTRTLSVEQIKKYINLSKLFLDDINAIIKSEIMVNI